MESLNNKYGFDIRHIADDKCVNMADVFYFVLKLV